MLYIAVNTISQVVVETPCTDNPCGAGACLLAGPGYLCACPPGMVFNGSTCVGMVILILWQDKN